VLRTCEGSTTIERRKRPRRGISKPGARTRAAPCYIMAASAAIPQAAAPARILTTWVLDWADERACAAAVTKARPDAPMRADAAKGAMASPLVEWRHRPTAAACDDHGGSSGGGEGGGDAGGAGVDGRSLGWPRFAIWAAQMVGEASVGGSGGANCIQCCSSPTTKKSDFVLLHHATSPRKSPTSPLRITLPKKVLRANLPPENLTNPRAVPYLDCAVR